MVLGGVVGRRKQKHEEIDQHVSSSLECFTKAVSSTRCHAVWPIRDTCGGCMCLVCMCVCHFR